MSLLLLLTLVGRVWAQNRTVTGRVIDKSTNEGLPGVGVIVKGTTVGTATDIEGRYSLSVPADANTLQFKFLGYVSTERPITGAGAIDVAMDVETKQLNEVVVTALGIQREKRALGYAVSEIKAEQVQQKSEPDVLRAIAGKVTGVQVSNASSTPGGSTRITIRGNTSLSRTNGPLFIVDGVPYDNDQFDSDNVVTDGTAYSNRAADIDPNNISSYTVLKGAAASALYGSRAANGVIVITTKTGSGQRGPKGVQVGYTTGFTIEKIAGLPEYQNTYGTGANFVGPYNTNGSWGPRYGSANAPDSIPFYGVVTPVGKNLGLQTSLKTPYRPYANNVKDFFETGRLLENSVTLTGSGDNATFSAVLSRADQTGIIPNSSFVRNTVSAGGRGTYNKFTIGGTVGYTNTEQTGPQIGGSSAQGGGSALSRIMFLPRNLDLQGIPYTNPRTRASQFAWLTDQADNPYWSVNNNSYTSRVDRIVGSANLNYAFTDWLSLSYTGGVNTYTDFRRNTVRIGGTSRYTDEGRIVEDYNRNTELEQTILIGFNKNLTEDISLRINLGQNINQRRFEAASFLATGIINYGIDNINNTKSVKPYGSADRKRRLIGHLTDITVGYKDWAYVNATARVDQSSTLNKNGEQGNSGRGFFYYSASGSVVLNEALKLDYSWLDMLKLRGGYAKVGNDADPYTAGPTRYITNPQFGNNAGTTDFPFNGTAGLALSSTIGNPALTPEFTEELEVGTELEFLKRRVSLAASYYDKRTTNQIAPVSLPASTGFNQLVTNFGEISNKGVEAALTVIPVQTENFSWSSTFNYTRNRNKVEKLREGLDLVVIEAGFGSGLVQPILKEGQPYGVLYGSNLMRTDDGRLLVNPATGRGIANPNPKIIGNPNPDFLLGVINTFTYRGITLNTLIDYRQGGQLYSSTLQMELGRGVTKDTEDRDRIVILEGVQANPTTRQPIRDANGNFIPNSTAISVNDYYFGAGTAAIGSPAESSIYDATTVRLREMTLGYNLPKSLLSKTPFGLINISLSGRNLFWYSPNIPKYTNFDPETSTYNSGSNAQGIEYTTAPSSRRYGVNLRVSF
ncbi:SusC/RagA family TonB-linked outer membrane protein [Hymenobacter saemangeumensis]|uniref:SusC/RagA family TonB-linked outer membrane protein n=1 Tax=Hymenobacter saemangeumensis TaxID=1084522 RepID=A0ABP8HX70_9BACT